MDYFACPLSPNNENIESSNSSARSLRFIEFSEIILKAIYRSSLEAQEASSYDFHTFLNVTNAFFRIMSRGLYSKHQQLLSAHAEQTSKCCHLSWRAEIIPRIWLTGQNHLQVVLSGIHQVRPHYPKFLNPLLTSCVYKGTDIKAKSN